MKTYSEEIKKHLKEYKENRLGIYDCGKWNGNEYNHILPRSLKKLNIIEAYRKEFWEYFTNSLTKKDHKDFHHLNSSQAMCFNLFIPFIYENKIHHLMSLLLNEEINEDSIIESCFEKVIDNNENTNFDFFVELTDRKVFFEIKYTETSFGKCKRDEKHIDKFNNIYYSIIKDKVKSPYCEEKKEFYENYQILRNIYYTSIDDILFFIYPKENDKLNKYKDLIENRIINDEYKSNIKILFIEDLIETILDNTKIENHLKNYFNYFKEKYIINNV